MELDCLIDFDSLAPWKFPKPHLVHISVSLFCSPYLLHKGGERKWALCYKPACLVTLSAYTLLKSNEVSLKNGLQTCAHLMQNPIDFNRLCI